MTSNPKLCNYVKSFTWILVWTKNELFKLTDTDRLTWSVFSKLINVTHLNLSSVHHIDDEDYVRQNPERLFPKVRDLRLHGWMHRGLVRAILKSLDPTKLRSLKMDYLIDEGALPNGKVMYGNFASHFLRGQNEHLISWFDSPGPEIVRCRVAALDKPDTRARHLSGPGSDRYPTT
jgi:hypothetical protein